MLSVTELSAVKPPIAVAEIDIVKDSPVEIPMGYDAARIVVRSGALVLGELVITGTSNHRTISAKEICELGGFEHVSPFKCMWPRGKNVAVTIGTRDRASALDRALGSMRLLQGDIHEILLVDNAPSNFDTKDVVERHAQNDTRIRYIHEPRPGVAVARNRALRETTADVLLFTDDDVEVDPYWVKSHMHQYVDDVAMTTGAAFAACLDKPEQVRSEARVAWHKGFVERDFSLDNPPSDVPFFPFSPGSMGVGVNFGVQVDIARSLGGFDEALGAGTPTKGGEDCDYMIKLIRNGHTIRYTPHPMLWHHHRDTTGAFDEQMAGYAVGLTAYLCKFSADPASWPQIAQRLPAAARHFAALRSTSAESGTDHEQQRREIRGLATGPLMYLKSAKDVLKAGGTLGNHPLQ